MLKCVVCAHDGLELEFQDAAMQVRVCGACGHRQAQHAPLPEMGDDYYSHDLCAGRMAEAREETRGRQARQMVAVARSLWGRIPPWIDFGCGLGWFLREAKKSGAQELMGFDTSKISRDTVTGAGIFAVPVSGTDPYWPELHALPWAPEVASFFDVIEHFENPVAPIRRLLDEVRSVRHLVVKVPIADGVLFHAAKALRSVGKGPYSQLFQAGTFPPHYQYFSERSVLRLLEREGFTVERAWKDPDVDDLFARIPALSNLPGGHLAGKIVSLMPADSMVVVARVR